MPAPKKIWIPDGSVARYPSALHDDSVHAGLACEACHGGNALANTRAAAHSGSFRAVPLADVCAGCHATVAALTEGALHTTLRGYEVSLAERGASLLDATLGERYDAQCTKCHTARESATGDILSACGHCHVSVPETAGGGLLDGHRFQRTPSMERNCTACHGSRVKDEYFGLNNALLVRNRAALPASSPWKDPAYTLQPDVHKERGMECVECHGSPEIHGIRAPQEGGRYDGGLPPACEDCHGRPGDSAFRAVAQHTADHLDSMSCQVCHAQPYKNCFGCHTDVTDTGLAFYRINEGSPYYVPGGSAAPDALMTFRAGRNPRYVPGGSEKEYVALRHVPIDRDTFRYTGANTLDGLVTDVAARPTWLPATPHTIRRNTPITASCGNCHDPAASAAFWITDPVSDAHGWIPAAYEADEDAANAPLVR